MIYEPEKGMNVHTAITKAVALAKLHHVRVTTVFNDIELEVSPASLVSDILSIYSLQCEIMRLRRNS